MTLDVLQALLRTISCHVEIMNDGSADEVVVTGCERVADLGVFSYEVVVKLKDGKARVVSFNSRAVAEEIETLIK
jgi:hypothetical protein